MRRNLTVLTAALLSAALLMAVTGTGLPAAASALGTGPVFPGTDCPAFPADNVWNTPITGLPVDSHSAQ